MSFQDTKEIALALPIVERIALVQALWASIDRGFAGEEERVILNEVALRNEACDAGTAKSHTQSHVFNAARKALE